MDAEDEFYSAHISMVGRRLQLGLYGSSEVPTIQVLLPDNVLGSIAQSGFLVCTVNCLGQMKQLLPDGALSRRRKGNGCVEDHTLQRDSYTRAGAPEIALINLRWEQQW
jgi:hypothetical protein